MRNGVAPAWEGKVWFLVFFVVMPVLAYREWGGWIGVVGYALGMVALVAGVRFVSCRVRRVPFWTWE